MCYNLFDMEEILIYTDGSSLNNPGPASVGVIIQKGDRIYKYSEFIGEKTSNEAEYSAIIFALEKVKQLFNKEEIKKSKMILHTDSELVGKQINGEYKINDEKLTPLFIKAHNLKVEFKNLEIKVIPREKNKLADFLARSVKR